MPRLPRMPRHPRHPPGVPLPRSTRGGEPQAAVMACQSPGATARWLGRPTPKQGEWASGTVEWSMTNEGQVDGEAATWTGSYNAGDGAAIGGVLSLLRGDN